MSLKKTPDFLQDLFRNEMDDKRANSYSFRGFRLDIDERRLLNNGLGVPLTPKNFDLLAVLVTRAGCLVEKHELMETVWADTFVEDANLSRAVHTLRRALGEGQNGGKFIETVAKKGYRFVADVRAEGEPVAKFVEDDRPAIDSKSATGSDPHSSPRLVFACLALLLALCLGAFIAFTWKTEPAKISARSISIAILPFRPINTQVRDEVFELGFADSMIAQLERAKSVEVRPLTAIRGYTDLSQDATAIGREQKADYVVESNYLSAGGKFRVTSRLIRVHDSAVIETFEQESHEADTFAAGSSIVAQIGPQLLSNLNLKPVQFASTWGTANEEARRHYFQGLNLTDKRTRKDAESAVAEFERAVAIDPNYALGYVGLAYAHTSVRVNGGDTLIHCPKAREALERGLALDPNNAEGYSILGMNQHSCGWNQRAAEISHKKALELGPNSSFVHRHYGIYLTNMGRPDESIEHIRLATNLDPKLLFNEKLLGRALFFARRYDDAIAQLVRVRERDPNDPEQARFIYLAYEMKNEPQNALKFLLITEAIKGTDAAEMERWKSIFTQTGWNGVLKRRLDFEKSRESENNFSLIASLASQLGEKEIAFEYIAKEVPLNRLFMAQLYVEPTLDPIRDDPRYEELAKRFK